MESMLAQDKVLGGVFFSLETRLYNRSIIFHQRPACEKKTCWCALFMPFAGWQKTCLPPLPEEESLAQMEERTDVNTDKGWFECASAAKSGGGGEWQKKKGRKTVASGEEKERQE